MHIIQTCTRYPETVFKIASSIVAKKVVCTKFTKIFESSAKYSQKQNVTFCKIQRQTYTENGNRHHQNNSIVRGNIQGVLCNILEINDVLTGVLLS